MLPQGYFAWLNSNCKTIYSQVSAKVKLFTRLNTSTAASKDVLFQQIGS